MSYTRPTASAADATWQGSAAYTRPSAAAADASFLTSNQASGFTSTVFGAPSATGFAEGFTSTAFGAAISACIQPATGFSSSQLPIPSVPLVAENASTGALFGSPLAALFYRSSSFYPTVFGLAMAEPRAVGFLSGEVSIPSIPLNAESIPVSVAFGTAYGQLVQQVSGINSVMLGTPQNLPITVGFRVAQFGTSAAFLTFPTQTLGAITRFGAPTSPSLLTVQASGLTSSRLGIPFAFGYTPPNLAVLGQAFGIAPGKIGTPSAGWLKTGYASGMSLTTFGGPAATRVQQLAGFNLTLFGTSSVSLTQRASGFNTTGAGTPVSGLLLQANSTPSKLRFGQPDVLRSNTFSTYGINASDRFGRPSGFCRFNRFAASFVSGALGTPTCFQRHRVAPASTETRFGQPLLRRAATC